MYVCSYLFIEIFYEYIFIIIIMIIPRTLVLAHLYMNMYVCLSCEALKLKLRNLRIRKWGNK